MKVEAPFIHLIKLHTKYYLYDVNSKMIVNISNDLFDFFKSNENIKAEIEIPHKLEDEVRRLLKYDLFSKTDTGYEIEYPQGTNLEEILNNCMRIMTLQVTQNCNLRCKYCVYSGSYSNRVHSNKRMSFETAKSAIDFLYAHSSMTTSIGIGFYGGEPLLEFDLLKKCVEYAKMKFIGKDLSFTLTTNATLLTEEIMKFFVKNNFFVTISFDGPQVIQDKNRVMADGKSGSFETVMKNVEMFLNKYPDFSWHVSFNAVLDPTNDFSCSNDFFMNFETVKSITANGVLVSTDGLKKELEKDETFSIAYEYEMFKNFLCSCGKLDKIGSKLSVTTDKNGEAEVNNLYLGNYYVKEITPSEGYLLDEEEHDVVCDYEGDLVAEVSRSTTSAEQVIKQPFQLIKVSDNGDDTEVGLLAGAEFTAYLKSSLPVKADGSYDFDKATPVVIGENGATTITSDDKGHAVSIAIPYGTYVVVESKTPHNMKTIKPFEVKIKENHPTEPQTWRVFLDREFTAKLRVIKEDSDTKQTVLVPNAEFKIFNLDKNEYVKQYTTYPSKVEHTSFFTDEDGDLILPEALKIGNYRIEEVSAPFGYVVNDKYVNISVDTDTAFETDGDTNDAIITVEYSDAPAVGELTVEKKGEVLDGFKGGLLASSYEKEFVYKEGSLAGAKFKVYAAEDIYTADNQKDADGNRIKYYSKGDLVTTLTTGKDGKATAKNLPLGQYRVVEVEAPYGYVLNPNEQKVTFTYVDDKTPVIKESLTFSDDRQKLDMSVTKLDSEDNTPIAGAVFGLYADEDIKNVDGKVIIEKGTLLEKTTSDENGKIAFVKDYPFAKYVARELVKPAGYVTNEEAVNFDTKYQGQDVKTAVYNSEYKNTSTTFEFTKTDITSGAELTGATLTVLDKDGNVVDTWTSDAKEAHVIKRLVVGETYTLREEFAPYGYLKATDIKFTVEDTGKVQHVEMKDEVPTGSIVINKDGEFVTDTTLMKGYWYDFIFNFFKDSLAGVTFDVYAKEDIVSADGLDTVYHKAGDKVATIVTNDKGIARIDDLPLGKYYLVETKTIDGFVLDDTPIEADLSYIDQNKKFVFAGMDVTNERQKVQITVTKTDSETKEALEGAVFGLFAKEDIVNKDGKVIVKADTQIERTVTGKDGKAAFTSDLPLGQYYVKEIEAPKGYVKSDKIFDVDASYQGDKVKVIEFKAAFENAPIKVEISKTDITGKKELPGAKLSVIDADGKLVESWTSEAGKTHMIERLPVGKYTLREESAPYGYKVASDVTFEVKETAEIQKVSMKDEQAVGKIVIEKTDKVTGKPIEGVVFEVRDKDGKVLDTLTTDKNGHAESKELPICTYNEDGSFKEDIHYTVVETKAADGYILDETAHDVTLRYDDNAPEVVVTTLKLVNVPTEPKLPQTGDNANPLLYLGIGALALITGVGVGLRGRKKKNKQ